MYAASISLGEGFGWKALMRQLLQLMPIQHTLKGGGVHFKRIWRLLGCSTSPFLSVLFSLRLIEARDYEEDDCQSGRAAGGEDLVTQCSRTALGLGWVECLDI